MWKLLVAVSYNHFLYYQFHSVTNGMFLHYTRSSTTIIILDSSETSLLGAEKTNYWGIKKGFYKSSTSFSGVAV